MNCGHPVDVFCTSCPCPALSTRRARIEHLDAQITGLNLYGRTLEDKVRAEELLS
jgi:hypothetical protein